MLITITKVKSSLLITINLFIITYEWKRKGNHFPSHAYNNTTGHTIAYNAANAIAYGVTYTHNNINTITDNIKHIVTKYLVIIINLFIIITYEWIDLLHIT